MPQCCSVSPTWLDYLTAISLAIGVLGVLFTLWYMRSANFVSAWAAVVGPLQDNKVRAGRALFRHTHADLAPARLPPTAEWPRPAWWNAADDPKECAKAAYDAFDLAAIMVLHSRIPGFANAFVAEYATAIVATWEQGTRFLLSRWTEMDRPERPGTARAHARTDLYDCFSVLYCMAKHRQACRPLTYPHYSIRETVRLYHTRWYWRRAARSEREAVIGARGLTRN